MRRSRVPDVALAVFAGGSFATGFCSSGAHKLAPDAIFEAASLSKPVFAYGVLKLVQSGQLALDKPLAEYLQQPYEHAFNPFEPYDPAAADRVIDPRFRKITARMVLSHTSGLPNWSRHGPLTLAAEPGEGWKYSGEGYVYLQRVVEAITGQSAEAYLEQSVLLPLGMRNSSFVWQGRFANRALPGHSKTGEVMPPVRFGRAVVSSTLYTTLGDYSRFVAWMLAPEPGSPFALAEKPQVAVRPDLRLAWGLGLGVEQGRRTSYLHWGANPGFQSFFLCEPGTGRGVLFFTDSDRGLDLVDAVVRASVPGDHPALAFPMLHPKD